MDITNRRTFAEILSHKDDEVTTFDFLQSVHAVGRVTVGPAIFGYL